MLCQYISRVQKQLIQRCLGSRDPNNWEFHVHALWLSPPHPQGNADAQRLLTAPKRAVLISVDPLEPGNNRQFVHHMSGVPGQALDHVPTALELFGIMLATPPVPPGKPAAAHASKPEGISCVAPAEPSAQGNAVPPLTRIAVVALSRQLAALSSDVDEQIQGGWANQSFLQSCPACIEMSH